MAGFDGIYLASPTMLTCMMFIMIALLVLLIAHGKGLQQISHDIFVFNRTQIAAIHPNNTLFVIGF